MEYRTTVVNGNERSGLRQVATRRWRVLLESAGAFICRPLAQALQAVVGASATFSSLNIALDVAFAADSSKCMAGLVILLRARLISFGMVMGLGFLLVVSLVLHAAIQFAGHAGW